MRLSAAERPPRSSPGWWALNIRRLPRGCSSGGGPRPPGEGRRWSQTRGLRRAAEAATIARVIALDATTVTTSCRPQRRRENTRFRKTRLSANRPPGKRRSRLAANRRVVLLGPFGEPLVSTGAVAAEMPFRFSTKYQDAETGLLYYGYRYYDPITGRWPSRDPLGDETFARMHRTRAKQARTRIAASTHPYTFVSNSPNQKIDPFGLEEFYVVGTVVQAAGGPDETAEQRSQRKLGNSLGIDHVDLYYGKRQVIQGFAARNKTLGPEEEISKKIVATLSRVTTDGLLPFGLFSKYLPDLKRGQLRWGKYSGTCCSKATDEMRLASLLASPAPKHAHAICGNNCQTDIQYAIEGSCLKGYDSAGPGGYGFGPGEIYYMTDDEIPYFEWPNF